MPTPAAVVALLSDGDVAGVDALLTRLSADERRAAVDWFMDGGNPVREIDSSRPWPSYPADSRLDDDDPRHQAHLRARADHLDWCNDLRWAQVLCAVRLLGPAAAARRVLDVFWLHGPVPVTRGRDVCEAALWEQSEAWSRTFLDALTSRKGEALVGANAWLVRCVVSHHGWPCPTAPTFANGWLSDVWQGRPALELMREDELMPAILLAYVETLDSPAPKEWAAAAATVTAEGLVDRAALVAHLFSVLDAPRRTGAQRSLADLVTALEVRADEVPGGLTALLGLLATAHGSVASSVLPTALELVADAASLAQLTTTVTARSEKGLRSALLKAAADPAMERRCGPDGIRGALLLLREGDDGQFTARVDRALTRLGGEVPAPGAQEVSAASAALGLWDLPVSAQWPLDDSRRDPQPLVSWSVESILADLFSSRETPRAREAGSRVDALLLLLDNGGDPDQRDYPVTDLSGDDVLSTCRRLLVMGDLSVSALTTRMEELFIGGGIRHLWDCALTLADLAAAAPTRPVTLHTYLRMLSTYAVEVPPSRLPPHLEALAAGKGTTKVHHEARRLGAVLGRAQESGVTPDELRGAATAPAIWRAGGPTPVETAGKWCVLPDTADLTGTAFLYFDLHFGRVHRGRELGSRRPADLRRYLAQPGAFLATIEASAHRHGVDETRSAVAEARYSPYEAPWLPVLTLWLDGRLTLDLHWALALRSTGEWPVGGITQLDALLRPQPFVWGSEGPGPRLTRLLFSETLLRVGRSGWLLSTPSRLDGTIELDHLLQRLSACRAAGVGPLDLASALHRLRPVDPARADTIDLAPVLVDPDLMWPPGESGPEVDAVEVLRAHVRSGGSSWDWVPAARDHARPRRSSVEADDLRVFPLDLDRAMGAVSDGYGLPLDISSVYAALRSVSAPLGVQAHAFVFSSLCERGRDEQQTAVSEARVLLSQDRLVPEHAVEAARRLWAPEVVEARERHHGGHVPILTTLARPVEGIFAQGQLRELWPSALAIAAEACQHVSQLEREGLADLLDVLTRYVDDVPDPVLPDAVRRLAASPGPSASASAARALVQRCDSRTVAR